MTKIYGASCDPPPPRPERSVPDWRVWGRSASSEPSARRAERLSGNWGRREEGVLLQLNLVTRVNVFVSTCVGNRVPGLENCVMVCISDWLVSLLETGCDFPLGPIASAPVLMLVAPLTVSRTRRPSQASTRAMASLGSTIRRAPSCSSRTRRFVALWKLRSRVTNTSRS